MRFYSDPVSPGSKRSYTPEGYLVIEDVPIARTGEQLYSPQEVGLTGDNSGVVRVARDPDEVFRPETIASFAGKDLLNDHPADGKLVNPQTWRDLTCGVVLHPRRGEGADADLMLADLMVKDPEMIRDIEAGKREVSSGYDCEYLQDSAGHGRQHDIIGNHVALVERGRCGARCSLGDHLPTCLRAPVARRNTMSVTTTLDRTRRAPRNPLMRFADRLRKAVKTGDEEELGRLSDEAESLAGEVQHSEEVTQTDPDGASGGSGELHVHVHTGDDEEESDDMTGMDRRRGRDAIDPDAGIARGGAEPDGDEPATKGDIAMIMSALAELVSADDEDDDLSNEENEGGEVADRRMAVRDRRRRARDTIRSHAKKFMDEIGDIVETKHNPDSSGRNDAPGTAGAGKEGIRSESVHRAATGDRVTVLDSRGLQPAWDLVVSRAEILSPGATLTEGGRSVTFDAATSAVITERRLCALRRRSLDAALATRDGQEVIGEVTAGQRINLKDASCASIAPIFNAASALMAQRNRTAATRVDPRYTTDAARKGLDVTPADMNQRNRERYKPMSVR